MGLGTGTTGCESVVLDFDGTMCLLFQNHDLAATRRRMCEELGRLSIDFDEALDAFDASSLLAVEEPLPWAYGCPYACDCRDRVVR